MTDQQQRIDALAQQIEHLRQQLQERLDESVELIQTHISWILRSSDTVWKFKKPVHWPFVDFSTAEQRKFFCQQEFTLNQRLAPNLYIGITSVWHDVNGRLSWQAPVNIKEAQPAELCVTMHRFADADLLSKQQAAGLLQAQDIQSLATLLAQFHAKIAGSDFPDVSFGSAPMVRQDAITVLNTLDNTALKSQAKEWRQWVEEQVVELEVFWSKRQRSGYVREGHGDLHLGNITKFQGQCIPFDCLEFQPAMRWIDVVNDVGFLSMDLQAQGELILATQFVDYYLQASGDYLGLKTWRFYEVYRALVRAMVAQLSAADSSEIASAGMPYVRFLQRMCQNKASQQVPSLYITHGFSGSGKTKLAVQLAGHIGALRLRSDVERKRLFNLTERADSAAAGLNIYTDEATEKTFARLLEYAQYALEAGFSVIVDAAFLKHKQREQFASLANQLRLPFIILSCQADTKLLQARIKLRQSQGFDASEATPAVLSLQQQTSEPLTQQEKTYSQLIETSQTYAIEEFVKTFATPAGN